MGNSNPLSLFPGRMIVVDDEPAIAAMMAEFLTNLGYQADFECNPVHALHRIVNESYDLVFTDIHMPEMSGTELLEAVMKLDRDILVILMTGQPTLDNTISAIRLGAYDYLTKPFNLDLVELMVCRAMQQRRLLLENREYHYSLERKVQEQTYELKEFLFRTVESLAQALEARDPYTKGHGYRVSQFVLTVAERLDVPESEFESLRLAGLLHDIGKIGVPDHILLKSGPLTRDEYELMKSHAEVGYRILAPIGRLSQVARYVYEHHERMDGLGYPRQLKSDEIHPHSRILMVAEVCDALATERCYKPAWPAVKIIDYFEEHKGTAYDSDVTDVLIKLLQEKGEELIAMLQGKVEIDFEPNFNALQNVVTAG